MSKNLIFKQLSGFWYLKSAYELKGVLLKIKALKESIRGIDKKELICEKSAGPGAKHEWDILLPECILNQFEVILNEINNLSTTDPKHDYQASAIKALYGESDEDRVPDPDDLTLRVQVEAADGLYNRIHLSGEGLPEGLRRLGIGSKIYERMVDHYHYVSSTAIDSSVDARLLWLGIAASIYFHVFIGGSRIMAFNTKCKPSEVISTLEKAFKQNNELVIDEDFLKQNKKLIQNSQLSRFL
jgi:hypothetical protein